MAGSMNRVILIGNLGRDPEVRKTQNGDSVANLSIATSESWKDKQTGEKREKTEWHRVSLFGKPAEVAERYLKKGSKVCIEGQLQTRKWTDQSGQEKYTTEVVLGFRGAMHMLDGANGGGGGSNQGSGGYGGGGGSGGYGGGGGNAGGGYGKPATGGGDDLDDEIPF